MIWSEDRETLRALGVVKSRTYISDTREHLGLPVIEYYFNNRDAEVAYRFYGETFSLTLSSPPRTWSPAHLRSESYKQHKVVWT